jgi:5-methylcytosine-specific restriction endonuclease McrA
MHVNASRLTLKGLARSKAVRFRDEIERMRAHTNLTPEWIFNRIKKLLLPGNYIACETCGMATTFEGITIDHKVPRTAHKHYHGNIHGVENLELVCPTCNSLKGQKSLSEYLAELEERNERIIQLRKTATKRDILAPLFPQVGLGTRIFGADNLSERLEDRGGPKVPKKRIHCARKSRRVRSA